MESGASSHPRMLTRARIGTFLPTSRGNLPRGLPKPQVKEITRRKEVGDLSPQSNQPNKEKEKFDEFTDKAHESSRSRSHREKDTHHICY
ncbi:hypothetical protein LIER_05565 [Lithospermum erythrorhizon]|uniref:Uncharacterized protein n=1 Tax=Lithospermum erythrorhizon TaxID=34254 RepID=A0AAV3P0Y6_LITER